MTLTLFSASLSLYFLIYEMGLLIELPRLGVKIKYDKIGIFKHSISVE